MVNKNSEAIPILRPNERLSLDYGSTRISETKFELAKDNHLTYPKAVIYILFSKFFEAFAANGVRTVLVLYLRDSLKFSEESSTTFYHIFNFFSQFCPVFGAVLADSYFGNTKTIFYLFFLYACGWIGAVVFTFPFQGLPIVALVTSSLILISIGNGSIRACITSLGGSQFQMPEQSKQLHTYFSHYYFIYTMGIMLSKIIPPAIRAETHCFGGPNCYTAVFGALATIFMAAWITFIIGMFFYKKEEIDEAKKNILFEVIGCIWHGVRQRLRGRHYFTSNSTHNPWIDGAIGRYPFTFVQDVALFLRVVKLFIPLPIYWALFAQIDSSWTFQATQLDTTVFNYRFQADQAKAMGSFLLLILIPFWQNLVIPTLLSFNIEIKPLRSVTMGGICASLSFICAGILQLQIESNSTLQITTEIRQMSILWQLPQFFLIMMGEVLLSIPGLQFSFTQAPPSLKSVLTAVWFCNNAFGNLIVVAITEWQPFHMQSSEYFLYAALMFVAILLFCWIANNYRYTQYEDFIDRDDEDVNGGTKLTADQKFSMSAPNVNFYRSQEGLDLIL